MTSGDSSAPRILAVSALVRRGSEVLLVYQRGPSDASGIWGLPGGVVEPGEVLTDALAREVLEETGLTVCESVVMFLTQCIEPCRPPVIAVTFEVGSWTGEVRPDDPDGLVAGARFVPLPEALDLLESRLPYRTMREPVVSALRGEGVPGQVWTYYLERGDVELVEGPTGTKCGGRVEHEM